MVAISDLTEADKGREVKYATYGAVEYGRITSWNERFVFVRYHAMRLKDGNGNERTVARTGTTSEATRPEDLEFCL